MRRSRLKTAAASPIYVALPTIRNAASKLQGICMSTMSRQAVLGLGLAGLLIDAVISHPAFAVNKVTLFKVTTPKQEIVIGLTAKELKQLTGKDAGAVAKALREKGMLTAWQYSIQRGASGEMEQAPLRHIQLASSD